MNKIERPGWHNFNDYGTRHDIDAWFTENIAPLNEMLGKAKRVYKGEGNIVWHETTNPEKPEAQAYIIAQEPIVKQTYEQELERALKDIIDMQCLEGPIIDAAKKILEEKE